MRDLDWSWVRKPGPSWGGLWGSVPVIVLVVTLTCQRPSGRASADPPPPELSPVPMAADPVADDAKPPGNVPPHAGVTLLIDCAIDGNCQAVPPEQDTRSPSVAGYRYAYAPSIVAEGKAIHLFYCSLGVLTHKEGNSPGGGDAIRYASSTDGGATWSRPIVVVKATFHDKKTDRDACDPCSIFFDGNYYLFYSTGFVNRRGFAQTAIQVARSPEIGGPYLTYTERGTWEETPIDPRRIIEPIREREPSSMTSYGAGQTAVVLKDDVLHMWYIDDSAAEAVEGGSRVGKVQVFHARSIDAIRWSPPELVSVDPQASSVDVKYDRKRDRFIMTWVINNQRCARVLSCVSEDGIRWSAPRTVLPPASTPRYAGNLGVLGDRSGWLAERPFLAFAAADDLAADDDCEPPPGTSPLTRLKSAAATGDQYFLTGSDAEIQRLKAAGWKTLNILGNIYPKPDAAPGLVPLRRFYYPTTGDHVFTVLKSEDDLARNGYRDEGVTGYVFPSAVAGAMPLYRLYNRKTGQHYYTTSRIENLSYPEFWQRDGIDGYLVAPRDEPNWGLWSLYRADVDLRGDGR